MLRVSVMEAVAYPVPMHHAEVIRLLYQKNEKVAAIRFLRNEHHEYSLLQAKNICDKIGEITSINDFPCYTKE